MTTEALLAAILAGAAGYVLKQIRATDLVTVVRRVAAGESVLDPSASQHVRERLRADNPTPKELRHLTRQERRVLDCIAEGLTNRQIGERLSLAEKTVKNYISQRCWPSLEWNGARKPRSLRASCQAPDFRPCSSDPVRGALDSHAAPGIDARRHG